MKSLMSLVRSVLSDIEDECGTSTTRDMETITRRVEHEGVSFLTITLPTFAKDLERGLEQKKVDSSLFVGYKRQKGGALPRFLGGLLSLVFDIRTGVLLDDPSISAITDMRQVCLMFKKVLLDCTEKRKLSAFRQYIQTEHELASAMAALSDKDRKDFSDLAKLLWKDRSAKVAEQVFNNLEQHLAHFGHMPKHGPGATADRIRGNSKYDLVQWNSRLEQSFPFDLFGSSRPDMVLEGLDRVEFVEPGAELPVRVISVPKTLKTPRIIACEPAHMQYVQQAVLEALVPVIETHEFSKGSVNFTSQDSNRELARLSSSGKVQYATLDLSEASDRVSVTLVSDLLEHLPYLREAVLSSRSLSADVPGYGVKALSKFASMGSALCFPIEAMVFYTIILLGMHRAQNIRPSYKTIMSMKEGVRVYGDDLIIPVDMVQAVVAALETFGLKVNKNKSFWIGKFRESCGMDAYDGHNVSPTYVRRTAPYDRQDVNEIVSWISLSNQLFKRGYWKAADYCRRLVEKATRLRLPFVHSIQSAGLGLHSFKEWVQADGWDDKLHRFVTRAPVISSNPPPSRIDGHGALLKFFLKRGEEPILDKKHLTRSGRPLHAHIKVRRVPGS